MKTKIDIENRTFEIKLTEKELQKVFKDINNLSSCDYKDTLKFIKELELGKLTLDFIMSAKNKTQASAKNQKSANK
jgi:hypothetical protein